MRTSLSHSPSARRARFVRSRAPSVSDNETKVKTPFSTSRRSLASLLHPCPAVSNHMPDNGGGQHQGRSSQALIERRIKVETEENEPSVKHVKFKEEPILIQETRARINAPVAQNGQVPGGQNTAQPPAHQRFARLTWRDVVARVQAEREKQEAKARRLRKLARKITLNDRVISYIAQVVAPDLIDRYERRNEEALGNQLALDGYSIAMKDLLRRLAAHREERAKATREWNVISTPAQAGRGVVRGGQ
ncbi:uncharacterized protein JCM6883_001105 [Sporobolomyces salmoneus]|uniref:uncharacterized protein n=1 Tax=Sporobolomyces salmoneus TaxID=183962 RepID=UPI00316F6A58